MRTIHYADLVEYGEPLVIHPLKPRRRTLRQAVPTTIQQTETIERIIIGERAPGVRDTEWSHVLYLATWTVILVAFFLWVTR